MTSLAAFEVVALGATELPYSIDVNRLSRLEKNQGYNDIAAQIEEWCIQQFGDCRFPVVVYEQLVVDNRRPVLYEIDQQGTWDVIAGLVRFMHERDLMLFKLRWA